MPVYVYPQGPSAAISKLKRVDENASANEPTRLDSEQQVAVIGETIPLIFCKRTDDAGGVWVQPRLIALGLTSDVFSLLYVLSQGRVVSLPEADIKYGATPLAEIDGHSRCLGYQQIPDCVDIEYTPGGSLTWTSQLQSSGPNLSLNVSVDNPARWTSVDDRCTGFTMVVEGTVEVSGSGSYVRADSLGIYDNDLGGDKFYTEWPSLTVATNGSVKPVLDEPYLVVYYVQVLVDDLETLSNGDIQPTKITNQGRTKNFDLAAVLRRNVNWTAYSYRTWSYRVINDETQAIVRTGTVKAGGLPGDQATITETGLPPAKYRVEFYATTALRSTTIRAWSFDWNNQYRHASMDLPTRIRVEADRYADNAERVVKYQNSIVTNYNQKLHENIAGNESVNVEVRTVTETVQEAIEFPDTPGQEIGAANYRNLTLLGITGTTTDLRPFDGPDYFLQLHCFCREGIYVKQQLQSMQLGPSNVYSDLILYLLEQGGLLKTEQIDYQALLYAARFCEQYKLHFNGVLDTTNSGAEYVTRTAPYFLLSARQVDGKYGLTPVVPIDAQYKIDLGAVQPVMVLTTDDMVQDSYSRQYINVHDRRPVCAVMLFRELTETSPGQPRTIEVRYPGTANDGPYETHDMTEFCVSANHAAYAARYILAKKRHVTHTVECVIGRRGRALRPGDIVQIDLDLDTTDGDGLTDSTLYEIESIGESVGGQVALTLLHFPVDSNGTSLIAKDIAESAVEIQ